MEEKLTGKVLTADEVQDVYRRRVLGPTCRAYFDYYRQRLKRYGEPGERAALAILQEVANAPTGGSDSIRHSAGEINSIRLESRDRN
jgi:hypothetical protein